MEDLSLIRLLAISQVLVFEEMEAFHQRESIYYEMNFPNLCIKENFCTQCWPRSVTMGIPTALCMN